MKVHGEGLLDGTKSTTSDTDEDEDEDEEIEEELEEDEESELDLDEMDNNNSGSTRGSSTKNRRKLKPVSSLNSEEDGEVDETDELEEEDNVSEGKKSTDIKREYSPEQSGDGKRPYRRNKDKLALARKSKRRPSENEAAGQPKPAKRGRKPKTQQQQQQNIIGPVEHLNQSSDNGQATIGNTPTYYPLTGYARQYASHVNGGTNYASAATGGQCNPLEQYHSRSLYTSQINTNQESNTSSSSSAATTGSASTISLNGNQHHNQQHSAIGTQQLSSPNGAEQTNGTSPPEALSEW